MSAAEPLRQLVVVGASAGGIEALSIVLATLPAEFVAPVVVAQHLDPNRPSRLEEILGRHSALPVRTVTEEARMDPGVVYLVPAGRDVEILDGHVRVLERSDDEQEGRARVNGEPGGSSKPSIDLLLRSAAAAYGEGLIAVILSGMGADGAAGARDVKGAGGTVVIQNPATARYPAMPHSLAPTTVDVVAELEAIGPLLHELLTGPERVALPDEERRLRSLLSQVREQTGIDFGAYKPPTIMRRLQRRMVATDTHRLADYLRYLQRHPEEYHRLASTFLIKVTGFFRDPELYQYLREHVLPQLIAEARGQGNELRIWSAGCATGEEAYSLAIMAADSLGDELEQFTVRVFATDLDEEAIAYARRGVYPAQALQDVPPELVARYFTEQAGEYTVRKNVRALTVFGQHDLGQRAPFPRIDLALCRNVLIYFTSELQRRSLQLFAFALRPGGYLALGKAETTTPLPDYFAVADAHVKVFRRLGAHPAPLPAARIRDVTPAGIVRSSGGLGAQGTLGVPGASAPDDEAPAQRPFRPPDRPQRFALRARSLMPARSGSDRSTAILQHLPIGVVVVDRRYDVQAINGAGRRLLGIHSAAVGEDLIHQVRTLPSDQLRAAIDTTLRDGPAAQPQRLIADVPGPDGTVLRVECFPYRPPADTEPMVMLLIADVTADTRDRRDLEVRAGEVRDGTAEAARQSQAELARLQAQVTQLLETNRELLQANQELVEANAELQEQNEALLIGHEEAEAATEEVETLNEELQATNEEQETLNEELQATVEELNTTNDDLEARSTELQELAGSLEAERTRLQVIVDTIADGVLVLDAAGTPVLANGAYRRMFGDRPNGAIALLHGSDVAGVSLVSDETLSARAATGRPFSTRFGATGPDGATHWYESKGEPIGGETGESGTVITIREVDRDPGPAPGEAT